MTIIALEGLRGVGKSTLWSQLSEKYPDDIVSFKFPTKVAKYRLSEHKYDMTKLGDVIAYNMIFIEDFISTVDDFYKELQDNKITIIDRYILSNLAHFKYDMYNITQGYLWDGMSKLLYHMYDNHLVLKPDLIIYLNGHHRQLDSKFDDHLYKNMESELEWFYNTELSNLKNILNIPYEIVESQKPNTFDTVDSIIKHYI